MSDLLEKFGAQPGQGDDKPKEEKKDEGPSREELQHKLELAERDRQHAEERAELYKRQAESATTREQKDEKVKEIADDFDLSKTDLVEIVSGNDIEGLSKVVQAQIRQALSTLDVTTRKDVDSAIAERLNQSQTETQGVAALVEEFPDLTNPDSELRKEAQRQLDSVSSDPAFKNLSDVAKARIATERASLALLRQGKQISSAEEARQRRIAAQYGSGDGRRGEPFGDEAMSEQERAIAKHYGVSEEEFLESKREMSVRIKG